MSRKLTLACAVVLVIAGVASAQRPRSAPARVSRIDVYNGPRHSVTYYGRNLTPSERGVLRELAEAQSDPPPVVVVPTLAVVEPVVVAAPAAPATEDPVALREARLALAAARVAGSPRLRLAFGMTELPAVATTRTTPSVSPAAADEEAAPASVVVTNEGKRYVCSDVRQDGAWLLVTTTSGKQMRLRATDVRRIEEPRR